MVNNRSRMSKVACQFAFAIAPVIVCFLYSLAQGVYIWNIDPYSSLWNDEMFYFKQVEAIAEYGMPLGYFGYSYSTAAVGTLAAWGIFPLLPYVPFVFLLGNYPFVMLIANLCFLFISALLFYRLVCPELRQSLWLLLLFCALPSVQRYTLSFCAEPLYFYACVIMAGLVLYLHRTGKLGWRLWALYALVLYLALCRPYFAAFALFPAYFQFRYSAKKGLLSFAAFVAVFLLLYTCVATRMQAAYFFPIIKTQMFEVLRSEGLGAFLRFILQTLAESAKIAFGYIMGLTRAFEPGVSLWGTGSFYASVMLSVTVCLAGVIHRLIKLRAAAWRDSSFLVMLLSGIIMLAIIFAIFEFYVVYNGARHLMAIAFFLCIIDIMLLTPRTPSARHNAVTLALLGLLALTQWRSSPDNFNFRLPRRWDNPYRAETVLESAPALSQAIQISPDQSRWDNTVIFAVHQLDFTYGYCLPAGTGIQFDFFNYKLYDAEATPARYILGGPDPDMKAALKEAGCTVLAEGAEYTLYERPQVPSPE